MVNRLKPENTNTTISISKHTKSKLRFYAKPKRQTKNGMVYESDAEITSRILTEYMETNPIAHPIAHTTYPSKKKETVSEGSTIGIAMAESNSEFLVS